MAGNTKATPLDEDLGKIAKDNDMSVDMVINAALNAFLDNYEKQEEDARMYLATFKKVMAEFGRTS